MQAVSLLHKECSGGMLLKANQWDKFWYLTVDLIGHLICVHSYYLKQINIFVIITLNEQNYWEKMQQAIPYHIIEA